MPLARRTSEAVSKGSMPITINKHLFKSKQLSDPLQKKYP